VIKEGKEHVLREFVTRNSSPFLQTYLVLKFHPTKWPQSNYRVCKHNHEFLICLLQGEKLLIFTLSDQFSNPYKSTIHMVLSLKSLDDLKVAKSKVVQKLWISIFKFLPKGKFSLSYIHGLSMEKWLINDFLKMKE
jgi:hypothetical protein